MIWDVPGKKEINHIPIAALMKSLQMIEYKFKYYELANELSTADHSSLRDICKPVEI